MRPTLKALPFNEYCHAVYVYNPDTGTLSVRETDNAKRIKGDVIAPTTRSIHIRKKHIQKTHLLWFLQTGEWTTLEIDHKNRNDLDDRFNNLRQATRTQNAQNTSKPSEFGTKGVYFCGRKEKPWQAQIRINGRKVNLGRFKTREEAAEVWRLRALETQGEFFCDVTTPRRNPLRVRGEEFK